MLGIFGILFGFGRTKEMLSWKVKKCDQFPIVMIFSQTRFNQLVRILRRSRYIIIITIL